MLLPHGAVVAVVDGGKLKLFRNSGNEAAPALSPMEVPKLEAHNKDSGARHISRSANPSARQLEEDAHAAAVTAWLNAQVLAGEIAHLAVIASPRTLGEMRRRYHKSLEGVLIGERHKELIGGAGADILDALQEDPSR
jgi:protein required for attachment to host cells